MQDAGLFSECQKIGVTSERVSKMIAPTVHTKR